VAAAALPKAAPAKIKTFTPPLPNFSWKTTAIDLAHH
jgi:hypothetical protein